MAGLGQRGQKKVIASASELFRKTERAESEQNVKEENSKNDFTQNSKDVIKQNRHPVRKQYVFAWELSEKLREYCFRERRKEVDVVREALADYFERRGI